MIATALSLPAVPTRVVFAPFCLGCGSRLPQLRVDAIGCPRCGTELVRTDGTRASSSRFTPWLHAAASGVLPGAGQALNGEPRKAIAVLLTCWLVVPWIWGVVDAWRVARRTALAPARAH